MGKRERLYFLSMDLSNWSLFNSVSGYIIKGLLSTDGILLLILVIKNLDLHTMRTQFSPF